MCVHRRILTRAMACFLTMVAVGGCGSRDDLGKVSGTINLDGSPLVSAMVQFTPKGGAGSISYGRTDGDGHYTLMFSRDVKGASIGENSVSITTADVSVIDGDEVMISEMVPTRYNKQTELVATVKAGSNTIDFDLMTGDDEIEQPEMLE